MGFSFGGASAQFRTSRRGVLARGLSAAQARQPATERGEHLGPLGLVEDLVVQRLEFLHCEQRLGCRCGQRAAAGGDHAAIASGVEQQRGHRRPRRRVGTHPLAGVDDETREPRRDADERISASGYSCSLSAR